MNSRARSSAVIFVWSRNLEPEIQLLQVLPGFCWFRRVYIFEKKVCTDLQLAFVAILSLPHVVYKFACPLVISHEVIISYYFVKMLQLGADVIPFGKPSTSWKKKEIHGLALQLCRKCCSIVKLQEHIENLTWIPVIYLEFWTLGTKNPFFFLYS